MVKPDQSCLYQLRAVAAGEMKRRGDQRVQPQGSHGKLPLGQTFAQGRQLGQGDTPRFNTNMRLNCRYNPTAMSD